MPDTENSRCFSRLKKMSKLERILCFIISASLLTIVIMIVTLAYFGYHYSINSGLNERNLLNVCLTPGCIKAASLILSNIDESVDPCDDFYRFACGQWLKTHVIPEDQPSVTIADEVDDNLNLRLKALLEAKLDGTEPRFITMVKDFYESCMDVDSIEKLDAEPLKIILKRLGGWPVIEEKKWDENKFDWIEIMLSLQNLGYDTLLKCSVKPDIKNTSRHSLYLDITSLGVPNPFYLIDGLNSTATSAYYKKMVKAAMLLGADKKIAEVELLEALQFEMTLANVPWLKYLNGFLLNEVYENETLIVSRPEYIKKIIDLIASTEKRVIANYICWMVVHNSASLLSKDWRDIHVEYLLSLSGASRGKPRWRQCVPKNELTMALSSLYVRHHFQRKTKDEVSTLVKYVYKEFLQILEDIDWMDEKTKAHAKAKAENMLFFIAYPDELLNDTTIMEHYQNLTISKDGYFENYQRIKKWSTDYHFSWLRKPNDRKNWKKYARAVVVNAYYDWEDNTIDLPAGYLNSPFFDKDQPNYMNFALSGSLAGHEITHGFDDEGRQYDKDGNNINWWEEKTDEKFQEKAQCIIDLYNSYTAENGMKVNGKTTLGENIADMGGLKESYLAYKSWVKDNGPEKLLPGLKYNQNQLFWISSAFDFCYKVTPEELKDMILIGSHSPSEFRVIGPRSNLLEFARDFNCPIGSPMNRKHKCQVW